MARGFRLLNLEGDTVRQRTLGALLVVGMLSLASAPARAGSGVPPASVTRAASSARVEDARVEAVDVTGATAIRLDGDFGEAVWQRALPIGNFIQRDPHEGAAPTFASEARVLFDKTYLYVAVRAFDGEPGKIVGIRTRRDSSSPSDWVRVVIDSYHDHRTAYEFAVNAAGVKLDRYWFADGNNDSSWDAVWDVSVTRDAEGWKAEFRIPFSQLRFETGKRDTFGFAVVREIGRLNETRPGRSSPRAGPATCRSSGSWAGSRSPAGSSGSNWCPTPSARSGPGRRRPETRSRSRPTRAARQARTSSTP